jgi:hypothetical protein
MPDIFLSYIHEEAAMAEALQTYLRNVYASEKVLPQPAVEGRS